MELPAFVTDRRPTVNNGLTLARDRVRLLKVLTRPLIILLALVLCPPSLAQEPTTQPVSVLGTGKRVTVAFDNTPPGEAFAAIEKQSGIKLALTPSNLFDRNGGRAVTFKGDDMPWLEAMAQLSEQAGLRLHVMSDRWMLLQGRDPRMTGVRATVGPLMFVIGSASIDSRIEFGQPHRTDRTLTLTGNMMSEPDVGAITVTGATSARATDDLGRQIDGSVTAYAQQSLSTRSFNVQLPLPDERSQRIESLKAVLLLSQLYDPRRLAIDNVLSEGQSAKVGNTPFKVVKVEDRGNRLYEVTIEAGPGKISKDILTRLHQLPPPYAPRLSGPVSAYVRVSGTVERPDGVVEVKLSVRGAQPKEGAAEQLKLTWTFPTSFREVEAEVEFNNIPIP